MIKQKIGEMSREITCLSDTITAVENELSAPDVLFLQNFTNTMKRAKCTLPDPEMVSGALLHEAKHLSNLQFSIWSKMQGIVQYAPVTLDPNTANSKLILSEDLTCLKTSPERQQFPDNPERFNRFACALGSEVINSNVHSWDVEVGECTYWILGVITKSVQRKEVDFWNGVWCLQFHNGDYEGYSPGKLWSLLDVKKRPQRVRVQLDWDRGKVSFSDPITDTHLHTLMNTFTEGVLPLFHNGCKHSTLKILPSKYHLLV
ncbi:zinc-binding protein A33-like [Xyrauchen texanus]|uniref:zinc-binding protein A33-like n=1 Tax=Xyrauchen texanus TaxID=154827 RepID=UPI00224291EC|nr:zinc-binding protein A33-like [Xyrauchen texanus]